MEGEEEAMRFRDPTEWLIAARSASLIAILCEASKKENAATNGEGGEEAILRGKGGSRG